MARANVEQQPRMSEARFYPGGASSVTFAEPLSIGLPEWERTPGSARWGDKRRGPSAARTITSVPRRFLRHTGVGRPVPGGWS
jgi:hypothetical protein